MKGRVQSHQVQSAYPWKSPGIDSILPRDAIILRGEAHVSASAFELLNVNILDTYVRVEGMNKRPHINRTS